MPPLALDAPEACSAEPVLSASDAYVPMASRSSTVHDRSLSYRHIIDTNKCGVATIAVPGVRLQPRDLGVKSSTLELMCVRVVSGTSSFIAAVVYRPGSTAVSAAYFDESSDVIDRLATFAEPVLLQSGDVNIRPERSTDSATNQFTDVPVYSSRSRLSSDSADTRPRRNAGRHRGT